MLAKDVKEGDIIDYYGEKKKVVSVVHKDNLVFIHFAIGFIRRDPNFKFED